MLLTSTMPPDYQRIVAAAQTQLVRDNEFSLLMLLDADENYPLEILHLFPHIDGQINWRMFARLTGGAVPHASLPVIVQQALHNLPLYIDAMHQMRVRMLYFDPYLSDRLCDHCQRRYTGPAVFCSLACALAGA